MPTFEEICRKILKTPNVWQKIAIGGILSFVPVLNFFALGYIYRYLEKLQLRGDLELPEWERWDQLFFDGIRMAIIGVIFFIVPVALLKIFIEIMSFITFGVTSVLTWTVMGIVLFVLTLLFSCALYYYMLFGRWQIFLETQKWLPLLCVSAPHLILPTFTLWGLWFLCLPFYGFACFFGLLLFLSYAMILFSLVEEKIK
jgi:hypothetical protein